MLIVNFISLILIVSGQRTCVSSPSWRDSGDDKCDWYNVNSDSCGFYDVSGQASANLACCECGGGRNTGDPSDDESSDDCLDQQGWYDSGGDGCEWYIDQPDDKCHSYGVNGVTAADVCCICGGGVTNDDDNRGGIDPNRPE
jgi:hypothetical protein